MTKSQTRQDCEEAVSRFAFIVNEEHKNIKNPRLLYCGVAGNPLTHNGKPGLDQPELFTQYDITTIDFDKKWNPDIVGDITKPSEWYNSTMFYDLVIITQVIEHIKNVWDVPKQLKSILSSNGYIIVDSPWGTKAPGYHGEYGSFGDYWRISIDGMMALFEEDFTMVEEYSTDANTSCLFKIKE